jgi:hypothetical protein
MQSHKDDELLETFTHWIKKYIEYDPLIRLKLLFSGSETFMVEGIILFSFTPKIEHLRVRSDFRKKEERLH